MAEVTERTEARRVALIRVAVQRATGGKRPASGSIACPACDDGAVAFAVTESGSIHLVHSTPRCWAEGVE
jgi:hypothetical protein